MPERYLSKRVESDSGGWTRCHLSRYDNGHSPTRWTLWRGHSSPSTRTRLGVDTPSLSLSHSVVVIVSWLWSVCGVGVWETRRGVSSPSPTRSVSRPGEWGVCLGNGSGHVVHTGGVLTRCPQDSPPGTDVSGSSHGVGYVSGHNDNVRDKGQGTGVERGWGTE